MDIFLLREAKENITLQTWKHLETPNHNPQSKRDPSEMQQKRADIQKIGN